MTITVNMPDGSTVNFPDGTDPSEMQSALAQHPAAAAPKPAEPAAPMRWQDLIVRQGLGQGAGAGFGDEGEAATRATYDMLQGTDQSWSDLYDKYLANARTMNKSFETQHPTASTAAQLTGALGTALIPVGDLAEGAGLLARGAQTADTLGTAVKSGAKTGAALGAAYGFGTGEGVGDRLTGAATGAATGAVAGAALPVAGELVARGAKAPLNVLRSIRNPDTEAARQVATAIQANERAGIRGTSAAADAAEQAGQPITNLERAGQHGIALGQTAANTNPAALKTLTDSIEPRIAEGKTRAAAFIDNLFGGTSGAQGDVEALQKQLDPMYKSIYAAGDRPLRSNELERLMGSPDVVKAMREAVGTSKSEAVASGGGAFNPGVKVTDDGRILFQKGQNGAPAYPNLQYWDQVKRELDAAATKAENFGDGETARRIGKQATQLRAELDKMVPQYQATRNKAVEYFGARDALSAGQKFLTGKVNWNDAYNHIQSMSPAERELFGRGFAQSLMDKVQSLPDQADIAKRIFNSQDARNRMRIALGNTRANDLEAYLRGESLIHASGGAVKGYSTTARQLMGALGIGAAANTYEGNNPFNPMGLAVGLGATHGKMIGSLARQAVSHGNSRVAESIAHMLTSEDPRVVAQGYRLAARNPHFMAGLRRLGQAGGAIGGRYGAAGVTQP